MDIHLSFSVLITSVHKKIAQITSIVFLDFFRLSQYSISHFMASSFNAFYILITITLMHLFDGNRNALFHRYMQCNAPAITF